MKMGPKQDDELKTVRGLKKFCALTGFTAEQVKAVLKTPAGAKAVVQDRYDPLAFCRAFNAWQRDRSGEPKTESEARTAKLNAERRRLEREEKIEVKELYPAEILEAKVWHNFLSVLRAKWMNLSRHCAPLCNKENPAAAKKVLDDYTVDAMAEIERTAPEEIKE